MSKKQDRQGARTPAQLEQKYRLGNAKKALAETQKMSAQTRSDVGSLRRYTSSVKGLLTRTELITVDGERMLNSSTYAELKSLWSEGGYIVVYTTQADGTCKDYICMGTAIKSDKMGLLFGRIGDSQTIFIAEDDTITVA